jgi:hypothetical protein
MQHILPPQLDYPLQCVLDFGPPLPYDRVCTAYTKEKFSLWTQTTDYVFDIVALRGPQLPKARLEGTLYYLTEPDIISLDLRRGNGVSCDRKYLPILTQYRNEFGDLLEAKAWIYIGRREHWLQKIEFDNQSNRIGNITNGTEFNLVPKVFDEDRILHNRQSFMYEIRTTVVGEVTPAIRRNCRVRNNKEILRCKARYIGKKILQFMKE